MNSTPPGDLRSTATEVLRLESRSVDGACLPFAYVTFGTARSTLMTDAPLSASRRPANGPFYDITTVSLPHYYWHGWSLPGARPANSRTRIPESAGAEGILLLDNQLHI